MNFRQTFIVGAFWEIDKLIRFWGQKVKSQGHIIARRRPAHDAAVEFSFLV